MEKYYINYDGEMVGPLDIGQLKLYGLTKDSMVRKSNETQAKKAFMYPELMVILSSVDVKPNESSSFQFSKMFSKDVLVPEFKVVGIVGAVFCLISLLLGSKTNPEKTVANIMSIGILISIWWIARSKTTRYNITAGMQVAFGILGFFLAFSLFQLFTGEMEDFLIFMIINFVIMLITNSFVVLVNTKK